MFPWYGPFGRKCSDRQLSMKAEWFNPILVTALCADRVRLRHGEGRARPHPRGPDGVVLPGRNDQVQ